MHTDSSLRVLGIATSHLGEYLCYFTNETCRHFQTVETDLEYQACTRAAAKQQAKIAASTITAAPETATPDQAVLPAVDAATAAQVSKGPAGGKHPKTFNMAMPKAHALPDYVQHIKCFGGTNGFLTVVVCSLHISTALFYGTYCNIAYSLGRVLSSNYQTSEWPDKS